MDDQRLNEIRNASAKASPGPWEWAHDNIEEPTDDPELLKLGIDTIPAGFKNIQLKSANKHRFWIELTDTGVAGDLVFDFDFIIGAREWVPELLAEVERLRALLAASGK